MRWYTGVALALFVVVALTGSIGTHKSERVAPNAIEKPLDPEPILEQERARPATVLTSLAPPPQRQHQRTGVGQIKGRVIFPPGEQGASASSDISVSADDGMRVFEGRVTPDGRFAFHLPPGRYTLDASAAQLVGTAPNVIVGDGEEREVDIRLGAGAAIRGTLHAPKTAEISVSAKPSSGLAEAESEGTTGAGTFEVTRLIPGRKYDLTFDGPNVRKVTLREVTAPADGLEVTFDALAVVRGAIGFPRGTRCPINDVALVHPDAANSDDEALSARYEPDADCRFELAVPEDVFKAKVIATGPGWFLEQSVDIPASGDPQPLCLNPPCRENPTEGLARVRVMLEDAAAGSSMRAVARTSDGYPSINRTCRSKQGWCEIEDLPVGEPLRVEGYSDDDCVAQAQNAVLVSGDNLVRLSCHHYREVEGVVRIANGALPENLIVRCPAGRMQSLNSGRLFEIHCPAEDSNLEYQVERDEPWHSIPLPSGSGSAFVEITL